MHKLSKKYLIVIAVLAVAGMLDSAYLVYKHFKPTAGTFCNFNNYINCDIVNQSTFAEIFGVPVAALGFLTYLVIFILSLGLARDWLPHPKANLMFATLISFCGLFFSLYLTYVELFILEAVCLLCVVSQMILIFISIFTVMLWIKKEHAPLPELPL